MKTEGYKLAVRAVTSEDASIDICDSLSHLLGRELTADEKLCMSIKAKYWFLMGAEKQNALFEDKLDSLSQENLPSYKVDLPSYKVDYAGWHGELE